MKPLYKMTTRFINNLKLKQKLMLSYFILILIPMIILTSISYRQASQIVEGQVLFSAKQVFEQTNAFLSYKINNIVKVSDIIAVDRNVNTILCKEPNSYSLPEQLKDMQALTDYLKSFQENDGIFRVRLYVNDKLIYAREKVNLFSFQEIQGLDWYKKLQTEHILWVPSFFKQGESSRQDEFSRPAESEQMISMVRLIRDLNWYLKVVGVLQLDIPESDIRHIITNANTTKHGVAYLQNSDGFIMASSNDILKDQYQLDPNFCKSLASRLDNWAETNYRGKKILVGAKNIFDSDWILVSVIPFEDILSASSHIRNQMFLLMLALGSVAYILAYYISNSTTKRIELLIQKMRKVQNADLNAKITTHSKDEIGELTENFNYMIEKMTILIKEQYQSGQEVKNAELKALQAQINPHFLYNTLDLINWSAIKNKIPEISSIVQSLAKFYRLSLSKGQDVVPIADEITHAKLYVDIQNQRFENKIDFQLDIDERILDYSILKLILQPLVENSIIHGIMEKESKSGMIRISGRLIDDRIILQVQDNGVGMTPEKLQNILSGGSSSDLHGYGVRNIDERIKLFYGNEFGLSYESSRNSGTTVTIKIPRHKHSLKTLTEPAQKNESSSVFKESSFEISK